MNLETIRANLIHAATRYDRAQEKKKHYNQYALAQYFGRIEDVMQEIAGGKTVAQALEDNFCDRLPDALKRGAGI